MMVVMAFFNQLFSRNPTGFANISDHATAFRNWTADNGRPSRITGGGTVIGRSFPTAVSEIGDGVVPAVGARIFSALGG